MRVVAVCYSAVSMFSLAAAVVTMHAISVADLQRTQYCVVCYCTCANKQLYNWQAIRLLAQEKIEALDTMPTGDVLTGYKRLRGDPHTAAPAVAVLAEAVAADAMQE
jgi:hypothetical protein